MNKLFVANLKSNLTINEVGDYIFQLNNNLSKNKNVVVCPSFLHIPFFVSEKFKLGSQDVSMFSDGPFTGEITAKQLSSSLVKYTIVGHSERRLNLNETDITINKKIKILLKNNITPILCIGETKEEKLMMKTNAILRRKILTDLSDLSKEDMKKVIIVYEPIWSIGTGITPTKKEIEEIAYYIKDIIKSAFKIESKILYGGSVNIKNINHFLGIENIDGFLMGTSSLNPLEFAKIVEELD